VNELGVEAKLPHGAGPVGKVLCSPTDPTAVLTVPMGAGGAAAATLWRMPPSLFEDPAGTQRAPRRYGGGDGAGDEEEDDDDYARSASSQHASSSSLSAPQPPRLEALARLEGSSPSSSEIVDAAWGEPSDEPGSASKTRSDGGDVVVTLERGGVVTRWDAAAGRPASSRHLAASGGGSSRSLFPPRVALDPHSPGGGALAVSRGPSVRVVDWRAGPAEESSAATLLRAHPGSAVTGLDYNPNRPNVLATSGQDGLIKVCVALAAAAVSFSVLLRSFLRASPPAMWPLVQPLTLSFFWISQKNSKLFFDVGTTATDVFFFRQFFDLRSPGRPLLAGRGGHSHWACSVQYNPFHDQLVLSAGTDSVANLWRVSTISSAPLLTLADDGDGDEDGSGGENDDALAGNARVARHERHGGGGGGGGGALYGAAWGRGGPDPWIYATLAGDGRVSLHHVPSQEKYKILL
jgi:WD40 repeat protein